MLPWLVALLELFPGVGALLAVGFEGLDVVDSPVTFDDCAMVEESLTPDKSVLVAAAMLVMVVSVVAVLVMVTVGSVGAMETFVVPVVGVP